MPGSILIIDDEEQIRWQFRDFLERLDYHVDCACSAYEGMERIEKDPPDVAIVDIRLPGMDGLEMLKQLSRKKCPMPSIIVMSGHGTLDSAIIALRYGAVDFLKKPVNLTQLEGAVARCIRLRGIKEKSALLENPSVGGSISDVSCVGCSEHISKVRKMLEVAASSPCKSILITGETGTGKEVMAKLFHDMRYRGEKPFVAENCPAIAESLIESELFGHVKGAFTGADNAHPGAFERADGGTLFLDEIGDLDQSAQAKLLRVLETRSVRRVGSEKETPVDVTVIAATNCNLAKQAAQGKFRQDLFFRLNVFSVHLQPLRNRKEDVLPLANYFAQGYLKAAGTVAKDVVFSDEAVAAISAYHYPGNIRELRNIVERACIISAGERIERGHLEFAYGDLDGVNGTPFSLESMNSLFGDESRLIGSDEQKPAGEVEQLMEALNKSGWNMSRAARMLNISYDAMRWRIKKYNLQERSS